MLRFTLDRLVAFPLACLAGLALLIAGCGDQSGLSGHHGGDFVLQSATGPVDTRALRGSVLLIYFGYVNCPDICPASMAAGAAALNLLKPEERARTRMIMVSVDPARDTPALLKEYAAFFHPEMIGATGGDAEVAAVAASFGVGYRKQPPNADGGYAVDHTSHTYVIDAAGKLAEILPLGVPPEKVAATVRGLL